jgi:hypothetical protein
MRIVFDNEEERQRTLRMLLNSMNEIDVNAHDRILLMGIKTLSPFLPLKLRTARFKWK